MNLHDAVREFFKVLDEVEEKDSGVQFHPTYISTCRVAHSERLRFLFGEMKREVGLEEPTSTRLRPPPEEVLDTGEDWK